MAEKKEEKGLALLKATDLTKVENTILNPFQLQMLLKRTPQAYVRERPAKGGGTWKYVSGGYFRKVLNMMFGWDWDFEIKDKQIVVNQVIVEGRLTVRSNGTTVIKEQIGKKDIIYRKGTETPLDIGNDFKAAATDALKKCAAELGIAADVYNASEFREVEIDLSGELSPTEIKRQKEIDRLRRLIEAAEQGQDLVALAEHVEAMGDEELQSEYEERLEELSTKEGGDHESE